MVYNISFDIAALFITAIPLVFMKVRNDMQILENRIFFAILIMHLITTSLDILSSISNSYIDLFSISVRSLLNYLYIIMHGSEPIVFTIFIIVSLKLYINATKTQKLLFWSPAVLIMALSLISNPFTHSVFYYDAKNMYQHGSGMYIYNIGAIIYMFIAIIIVHRQKRLIVQTQRRLLLMILIFSIVPVVIQLFF